MSPPWCTVAANRFLSIQSQCFRNGLICQYYRFSLIRPGKLIALLPIIDNLCIDFLHQYIFIDGANHIPFIIKSLRDGIGEQLSQLLVVILCSIWGMHLKLFHV